MIECLSSESFNIHTSTSPVNKEIGKLTKC